MKRFKVPFIIGSCTAVVISVLYFFGFFNGLENKSYDLRFRLRGEIPVSVNEKLVKEFDDSKREFSDNIVIAAIDEESIREFGRWPWPRNYHKKMIETLARVQAKLIVYDVLLSEHDKNLPFFDLELARITEKHSHKIIYANFIHGEETQIVEGGELKREVNYNIINPFPELDLATMHKGLSNAEIDSDGVLRKALLQEKLGDFTYYSLNLVAAALFKGLTPGEMVESLPEEYRSLLPINYRGFENIGGFRMYSFNKLVDDNIPDVFKERWVKDKIVLIGSTTIGTFDHYPIPYTEYFPGVLYHANVIDNLVTGDFIRFVPWQFNVLLIFVFAVGCAFLMPFASGVIGSAAVIGAIGVYTALTQLLFAKSELALEFTAPITALMFTYVAVLFYRFLSEEKEKRWIKKSFGTYVSPAVIDQIVNDPSKLKLGGERKNLTILFSDIRNFTTLSEGMTPEGVVEILNEYLTKMTEIVFSTGGTLDKFIGDAVMAFWGAPVPMEDHPSRAVKTAILMFRELKILREKWAKEGKSLIDIGIGINTGDVVVGNMGSIERMDYTVIGDNVNLASRLESLNKQYLCHIIISEATYEKVKDLVNAEPLGNVKVKGKEKEVAIYRIDENMPNIEKLGS